LHHPLPDHELPPDPDLFRAFAAELARRLSSGEHIGIHCWGSIGRATLAAVATLVHLGWPAEVALRAVEAARGCPVPDTPEQKDWLLAYKARG
jgi:protein-tyrosine phosphatase